MATEQGTSPNIDGVKEYNTDYNLIPPDSKPKEVGKKVFQVLDMVLSDKDDLGLPGKWKYHYELGKNKHWKHTSKKVSLMSANLLNTHRQRTVNMLTDNNPTFNVVQIGQIQDEEILDTYVYTAQHWWHDQKQQQVLDKSIVNGETFGCTIQKVIFNPELEYGQGEVETIVVPPHYYGVYPVECRDNQKAEANFHFYPMSLREAKRRWPEFADKIKSDSGYLNQLGFDDLREVKSGISGRLQDWFASISSVILHMVGNVEGRGRGEEDKLLIVECWAKDYTRIENNESKEPKYPGEIRYIVSCNGGEVVMEDRGNPSVNPNLPIEEARKTYLFDKFPFIWKQSNTDTANGWGCGDFEQLKSLNLEVNKTLSQFNLFKDKASRLKIINPMDSGVPNSALDNFPRIVRPANYIVAQGLRYMDPPKYPVDLERAFGLYKELFFLVAGTFELELAQTPGREVVSYKAIATLLERATTMLREKVRNYSDMITEQGRMFFSHVQNWYTDDRYITAEEQGRQVARKISGEMLRVPLKLVVIPGSTMPISQVQRREEAIGLAKDGRIDTEELLKRLDWPDWRNVVKRMKAGPFAEFMESLAQLGMPPEILQYMQQIFSMEKKDLEGAIKSGELPTFPQILQALISQGMEPPLSLPEQVEIEEKQASIAGKYAEAEKDLTEAQLNEEKVVTERLLQYVKVTGVELDYENLDLKRLQIIADLEKERMKSETAIKKRGQGPYREKGFSSNNQNLRRIQ